MTTEIIERATPEKAKNGADATGAKSGKLNKCKVCGTKTHQKDGTCVLCKTGITQAYGELKELISITDKQG